MWKSSKRYMKEMRSLLYRKDKDSRRFLAALEGDIEEYMRLNPAAAYEGLVSEFGSPANNIKEYYLMRGEKFVIKTVRIQTLLVRFAAGLAALAVLILLLNALWWQKSIDDLHEKDLEGINREPHKVYYSEDKEVTIEWKK